MGTERQCAPAPGDHAATFCAGLLNPSAARPADAFAASEDAADRRYDVYRNNVTVSLVEAIAAIYPAVRRLTGPDFFRAMARSHIRETPPASPLLFEYGRDFPAYIERYEHAQALPWLADVARIERAWLDAYHAADGPLLAAADLAGVAQERLFDLVFRAHPATRLVRSRYPAASIFALNRRDGEPQGLCSDAAEDALITRPCLEVTVRILPPGGAAFLQTLIAGGTLGAAAHAAFDEADGFDLSSNLADMLSAGVFTSLQVMESA